MGDPARFMSEIVGTDGDFTRDEITFHTPEEVHEVLAVALEDA